MIENKKIRTGEPAMPQQPKPEQPPRPEPPTRPKPPSGIIVTEGILGPNEQKGEKG